MDRVEFVCPACRNAITAPRSLAGQPAPCPRCRATVASWPTPQQQPLDDEPEPAQPRRENPPTQWERERTPWPARGSRTHTGCGLAARPRLHSWCFATAGAARFNLASRARSDTKTLGMMEYRQHRIPTRINREQPGRFGREKGPEGSTHGKDQRDLPSVPTLQQKPADYLDVEYQHRCSLRVPGYSTPSWLNTLEFGQDFTVCGTLSSTMPGLIDLENCEYIRPNHANR